jgi:hypothetical protein
MRTNYYVRYTHSAGESWRVYEVWFWQTITKKINKTMEELEKTILHKLSNFLLLNVCISHNNLFSYILLVNAKT